MTGLFVALGLRLLPACGLGGESSWLSFCPDPPADDGREALLQAERARGMSLEDRLARLHLTLAGAPACPAPPPSDPPLEVAQRPAAPEPPVLETEPPLPEPPLPQPGIPDRRPPPPPLPEPEPAPEPPPEPPPPDEFDRRVEREGGQRGDVQITLIWDNVNDLDLHVHCPNGNHIYYAGMFGCGGRLDVDANGGGPQTRSPVENVTWPGGAPSGPYRIEIDHFSNHGGPEPTPYRVRVRIGGEERIYEGILAPGEPNRVIEIFVP